MNRYPATMEEFRGTLDGDAPPEPWSDPFKSLWWDAAGHWGRAHDIAQELPSSWGSRMHAYLHRKEGDLWNARYWYRRAGVAEYTDSLDREFLALFRDLLTSSLHEGF